MAINGFGRIGRLVLRAIFESGRTELEVVGDQRPRRHPRPTRLLLKRDSVHGSLSRHESRPSMATMDVVDGKRIRVTAERDPAKLPHAETGRRR